jgi:hypothetical protein
MSHYSKRSFLHNQLQEIENLQSLAGDHPVMAPSLEARRRSVEQELKSLPAIVKEPRTVLFFSGNPVVGSQGIDASFASDVINPFLEMVKTEYSMARHGAVGSRGPRRGEAEAKLLLSGLPRGSFGLELSRPPTDELLTSFKGLILLNLLIKRLRSSRRITLTTLAPFTQRSRLFRVS